MLDRSSLRGRSVLITSPEGQSETLCKLIEAHEGTAIRCPALTILPTSRPQQLKEMVAQVGTMDFLIFLSKNAVDFGFQAIQDMDMSLPSHIKVLAIGPATESSLKSQGFQVDGVGSPPYSSESLAQIEDLFNVKGKSIMIFQGEDGRSWLSDKLTKNGANILRAFCYRRSLPSQIHPKIISHWESFGVDLIVFSSVVAAENLRSLLRHQASQFLEQASVIVVSKRIEAGCRSLGYSGRIEVATEASHKGLLQAIFTFYL